MEPLSIYLLGQRGIPLMSDNLKLFDTKPQVRESRLNVLPANPEESDPEAPVNLGRFPSWLHRNLPKDARLGSTSRIVGEQRLHTVCEEARCPNLPECYSKGTATFLIMGRTCTRSCGFCSIEFSKEPSPLDEDEPRRVAASVQQLGLRHVVITMVARDDLSDGGASHLVKVMERIRQDIPGVTIEVLISDFAGNTSAWDCVLEAKPEILNHNIETVRELTPRVRHKATYDRTLELLRYAGLNSESLFVKSGLMVGLGETEQQVKKTLKDLRDAGCTIVTIGQYLQSSSHKLRVKSFVTPDQFKRYEDFGYAIGVKNMYCGPFVRSSYNANLIIRKATGEIQTINSI